MRDARKTTLWLALFGSVSLLALPAAAQDLPADSIAVPQAAEPSFHDVAAPQMKQDVSIPLPDAVAASIVETDILRTAVEERLTDDALMRGLRLSGADRDAVAAFYAQAERPLAWSQDGVWTPAARAVIARLEAAGEDGLDPTDYPLPDLGLRKDAAPSRWAEADLKLSASAIRYARHARGGRIEPSRLSALITPKLALPEAGEVLTRLTAATDAGEALASYNPPHAGYKALKARLADLRARHPSHPSVHVPKGPTLRVGMQDPRVPLIRARFNLDSGDDETVYDERVASAVAAFQKEKGLAPDGFLGPQTIAALSGPSLARKEADLIANMERWRWLPADLGSRHILVNVPEYRLRFFDGGKVTHETRVIVGKAKSQTPIFSQDMKYLVVNPSWTIPPSILKKEILPALANDPYYAARMGYNVIRKGNRIIVQQPPGERNALGFVKFMFPNDHAVYLHDTPNRKLFSAAKRAFSHGCVRVEKPFELAEKIFEGDGKWSGEKLRRLIGKGERYVHLSKPLPVHLAYFTVAVDEKGQVKQFEDIYGIDRKVRAALGLPS